MVRVKCDFAGEALRRFSFAPAGPEATVEELRAAIATNFPNADTANRDLMITFVDEDGDNCVIEHGGDLREAIESSSDIVRLHVSYKDDSAVAATREVDTTLTTGAKDDTPPGAVCDTDVGASDGRPMVDALAFIRLHENSASTPRVGKLLAGMGKPFPSPKDVDAKELTTGLVAEFDRFVAGCSTRSAAGGAPSLVVDDDALAGLTDRFSKLLSDSKVPKPRTDRLVKALEMTLKDAGILTALAERSTPEAEATRSAPMDTDAGNSATVAESVEGPRGRPFFRLLDAMSTDVSKDALATVKEALSKNTGDRRLIAKSRPQFRKQVNFFLRETGSDGNAHPETDAVAAFAAKVKEIASDAGVTDESAEAIYAFAHAMASDAAVVSCAKDILTSVSQEKMRGGSVVEAEAGEESGAVCRANKGEHRGRPFMRMLREATTDSVAENITKVRESLKASEDDAGKLKSVRPTLRKRAIAYVLEHVGDPAQEPPADATTSLVADVRTILADAGVSGATVDASGPLTEALAADPGVRAVAAEIGQEIRSKRRRVSASTDAVDEVSVSA